MDFIWIDMRRHCAMIKIVINSQIHDSHTHKFYIYTYISGSDPSHPRPLFFASFSLSLFTFYMVHERAWKTEIERLVEEAQTNFGKKKRIWLRGEWLSCRFRMICSYPLQRHIYTRDTTLVWKHCKCMKKKTRKLWSRLI